MMKEKALRGGTTCEYLCLRGVSAESASRNKSVQVFETAFGTHTEKLGFLLFLFIYF